MPTKTLGLTSLLILALLHSAQAEDRVLGIAIDAATVQPSLSDLAQVYDPDADRV